MKSNKSCAPCVLIDASGPVENEFSNGMLARTCQFYPGKRCSKNDAQKQTPENNKELQNDLRLGAKNEEIMH